MKEIILNLTKKQVDNLSQLVDESGVEKDKYTVGALRIVLKKKLMILGLESNLAHQGENAIACLKTVLSNFENDATRAKCEELLNQMEELIKIE